MAERENSRILRISVTDWVADNGARDEPRYAIVRGLARMFDDPLLLRRIVRTEAPPLLDEESEAYSL